MVVVVVIVVVVVVVSALGQVYYWILHIVQMCESDVGNPRARCYRAFEVAEGDCWYALLLLLSLSSENAEVFLMSKWRLFVFCGYR